MPGSQEGSALWAPRETKAHFDETCSLFCEVLAVPSVIQKDPLCFSKADHLLSYFSVSDGSSVAVDKGHGADGYRASLLWQPGQRTKRGAEGAAEGKHRGWFGEGRWSQIQANEMQCTADPSGSVQVFFHISVAVCRNPPS